MGREQHVDAARRQLLQPDVRLLTLTGPPGIGKTRLALQVAAGLQDRFEHGAFFVVLASAGDASTVASTIAQTLGVGGMGGQAPIERLKHALKDRHVLLVLDNFEQVLAAPEVAELLATCPMLKVLVTSRAALRLRSEHEFPVPPLELPDLGRLPAPGALAGVPAVALFVERARAVKPDFVLDQHNVAVVAQICARLDGLPLAIELAAARSEAFPPQAILAQLELRLDLLTREARDLPTRQQTAREAIRWSYDLLSTGEQALLRRLAVFVDGCSLEAAEAVCNVDNDLGASVMDGVASLVDNSLLRQAAQPDGEQRLCMLETIGEYALEQLVASGEADAIRRRHAAFFVALAERAEPELLGLRQAAWLEWLELERDNLQAVLRWAAERDDAEDGLRVAGVLRHFWSARGYASRRRELLEDVLALPGASAPTAARAKALVGLGNLAYMQGAYELARSALLESRAIASTLQDTGLVRESLIRLGHVGLRQSDDDAARALHEQNLALEWKLDHRWGIASSLVHFGAVADEQGKAAEARSQYAETLAKWTEVGNSWAVAYALEELASLAATQARPERALHLAGAAAALREAIGTPVSPIKRANFERTLETARQTLPEQVLAAWWAQGRAMTPEKAIAVALTSDDDAPPEIRRPQGASAGRGLDRLTPREREVAALIARGLTNRQIATELVIATGTAALHSKSVLRKLGFRSRAQVAIWAVQRGLYVPPSD